MRNVQIGVAEMTLGEFIRKQRGRVPNLRQRDVADALGVSTSYISRLENDQFSELPSPDEMRELAEVLRCSEEDLLRAAGYLAHSDPAPVLTMAEGDARWDNLPPQLRRQVEAIVDAYFAEDDPV